MSSQLYPIFLNLAGTLSVVIGGGRVALRKVQGLAQAGARVRVVAPEFLPDLHHLEAALETVELRAKEYEPQDLDGAVLVFAATNNPQVNQAVAAEAKRRGILVCVVDQPAAGNFILPAVYRRGRLHFAVSTGGASPALARLVRQVLTATFGPEFEQLLELAAAYRTRAQETIATEELRLAFLRQLADPELLEVIRRQGIEAARQRLEARLQTAAAASRERQRSTGEPEGGSSQTATPGERGGV